MDRRSVTGAGALALTGGLVVFATFLPWVHHGTRSRTSYGLLGLVDRLGIAGDGVAAGAIRWWPLVPMLVTTAVLLGCWRRHRLAVAVAAMSSAYVVGVSSVLVAVRSRAAVELGLGVWLAAAAAVMFTLAAIAGLLAATSGRGR